MMDKSAFVAQTEEQFSRLYRVSYAILRHQADAQDAVQQALMKAWAAKDRVDPERFRAFLTRIVINESHNIQRYRMRVTPKDEIEIAAPHEEPMNGVLDAVHALPEKFRTVFTMMYIAGLSEKEIAAALHLPVSTVKNRLYRAREMLKKVLSDEEVIIP